LFGRDSESAVISLYGVYIAKNLYLNPTWELFFANVFLYGKLTFGCLFMMTDLRLAGYYGLLTFLLWLVSHPKYEGPSKIIKVKSLQELEELLGIEEDALYKLNKDVHVEKKENKETKGKKTAKH
jgi:hypothetical protein